MMKNKSYKRVLAFMALLQAGIILNVYLGFFAYVFADAGKDKKNILIISSYHQSFTWSRNITDGLIDSFRNSSYTISTFVEYMDWKNIPDKENLQYLKEYWKYKYQSSKIDILIAVDDAALEFVLENRGNIFSDAPVVFCGINKNGLSQITAGYKNLTGVLEEVDPTETVKMALSINPSVEDIYVLFDNTESGLSSGEIVINTIREMNEALNPIPLNQLSYEELISNARYFPDNSIVIVTTYYSDGPGRIVEFDTMARELGENSRVPVYHLYDMGLDNGAIGGVMTGGRIHGEYAAEIAIRILNGENADDILILPPETTRKVADYRYLLKFEISLDRLPKGTEIINKPFSFFDTYKTLVLIVAAVFTVLVFLVGLLLFNITKIQRMKKKLSDSHEELGQIYEELAASEEELKYKYNQIVSSNEQIRISEEKLSFLAYHDVLTGLPNKLSLYQYGLLPQKGRTALLFIDMDHFKYINDTMGHAFGDLLIFEASRRLSSLLNDKCTIYRLGGDEFVMLVEGVEDKEAAEAFASGILAGFRKEFAVQDSMIHVSLSIGVVLYPDHGDRIEELVKYADIAMYKAKEAGRNKCVLYDRPMNEAFADRANIEKHLHSALENNEFEIHYQPQLDLKSGAVTGLEALLRWKSPKLGLVSPLKFIKVAEDTHLIIPLGEWVMKKACEFLKKLHQKGYGNLSVAVNISMLQLLQSDFNPMVMHVLESSGLEPQYLELEITESILMESFETLGSNLEELNRNGIRIALDDFGKGYSSLNYLKQLPVSTLKVDKSFIDNINDDGDSNSLTKYIITIGKSMGMCVVAEGVERKEQLNCLLSYGCDKIQGYLYSRPLPEQALIALLEGDPRSA